MMTTMLRSDFMRAAWISIGFALVVGQLAGCSIEGREWGEDAPTFVPEETIPPEDPPPPEPQPRRVVFLHTNDEHSHLLGFSPDSEYPFLPEDDGSVDPAAVIGAFAPTPRDDQTVGGAARRNYLINKIRSESTDPVLVVSAGDNTMGTIFHAAFTAGAPDWVAMALMGYDVITLGNHEFDFGPDALAQAILAAQAITFGSMPTIVASNIHFDDIERTDAVDAGEPLESLFGNGTSGQPIVPWAVRDLPNGLRVGFLGLVGYHAALVAPAKDPIVFSVPEGDACQTTADCTTPGFSCTRDRCVNPLDANSHIAALAEEAKPVIAKLRDEQGADVVVALTHLGIVEDTALASLAPGIDVIIGGHSHDEIPPTQVGGTVIVQAGSYGRKLGQITIEVAVDGSVSYVAGETMLHPVDYTLDAEIVAGSDFTVLPPVISPALQQAMEFTGIAVGPVVGGLNGPDGLGPLLTALGLTSVLQTVAASSYDVIGESPFADSNLSHLVTDATRAVVASQYCDFPLPQPLIAVEANGVLRESLRFGAPTVGPNETATFDDVFRVVPLGASPHDNPSVPGYAQVLFYLAAGKMYAGIEVGLTNGLQTDDFFLSYAGMKVTYDEGLPAWDQSPTSNTGRVVTIALGDDIGGYDTVIFDRSIGSTWLAHWTGGITPATLFPITTNYYLAGVLDAFGLTPLDDQGNDLELSETVLCQTGANNCAGGANNDPLEHCATLLGSTPVSWPYPELKEWQALLGYIGNFPGAVPTFPAGLYSGTTPAVKRVEDITP